MGRRFLLRRVAVEAVALLHPRDAGVERLFLAVVAAERAGDERARAEFVGLGGGFAVLGIADREAVFDGLAGRVGVAVFRFER